jgi:hypothetical protein
MLRGALPRLTSLGIARGYAEMVVELAAHPIARQLEGLHLETNELAALPTLAANAAAFPKLRELSVHGIHEELAQAEVDALRSALERAYPGATIHAPWDDLVPAIPQPRPPRSETPNVDDQSRRPDGTIDAIARWNRGD